MNIVRALRNVGAKSVWRVFVLAIMHPLFVIPTITATKKCLKLSTEHFGKAHYENGPANAFRHALWNILIAKKCFRVSTSAKKVLAWAQKITDWHEQAFFNEEMPMKMDYHNNAIGRNIFRENLKWSQEEFIHYLLQLAKKAIKINRDTDLNQLKNQLVYITNDH